MKIVEKIKERRSPVLVILVLILVCVGFLWYPVIAGAVKRAWAESGTFERVGVRSLLAAVEPLFMTITVAIWMLSILITWAAYEASNNRAYIFILAYFFIFLVAQPLGGVFQRTLNNQRSSEPAHRYMVLDHKPEPPRISNRSRSIEVAQAINIYFPIGPVLLLAGVWYLYKKEERKQDEQEPSQPPARVR